MSPSVLAAIIGLAESLHGVPSGLLVSLCTVESQLNPYAVVERDGKGGRDSVGMCQLQTRTAWQFRPGVSVKELFNPITNANIAAAYLRMQYNRYGDWKRAVVAYNRGSSTGSGNEYSRKVMTLYGRTKRNKVRANRYGTERGLVAVRSSQFLREDLSYAN